ncbi:MAG TPA: alanine:cation symporter family protein, partial [Turneriella sp.]|nr:alanine:cation symporter family protein [Turneriella sp.]
MQSLEAYLSIGILILLLGISLVSTFYLRFVPLRYIFFGFRIALTGLGREDEGTTLPRTQRAGEINNLRAMFLSGSIQANAAVLLGIPVVVLWGGVSSLIWVILFGILLASLRFASGTLAVRYRQKTESGWLGGAQEFLALTFWGRSGMLVYVILAIAITLVWGAAVQADLWQNFYKIPAKAKISIKIGEHFFASPSIPLIMALIGLFLSLGSMRRVARVAAFISPIVSGLLILLSLFIIAQNSAKASQFLSNAWAHAFHFKSIAAGVLTALVAFKTIAYTGIVAPEEATGISSAVTAASINDYAVKQGLVSMSAALFYTTIV